MNLGWSDWSFGEAIGKMQEVEEEEEKVVIMRLTPQRALGEIDRPSSSTSQEGVEPVSGPVFPSSLSMGVGLGNVHPSGWSPSIHPTAPGPQVN